jgi:hypothetical protein
MRGTPGAYHAFLGRLGLLSDGWVKSPAAPVFLLVRHPAFFIPFFGF